MIRRLPDGRWFVDVEPQKGKRFRRKFKTKAEAMRFEAKKRLLFSDPSYQDIRDIKDIRLLSEIFTDWFNLYGHSLRDGKRRYTALQAIASAVGDPVASEFTGVQFAAYRSERLAAGLSPKTLNNHLGYVKAAFNELKHLEHIAYENPVIGVRPLRLQERELSWLTTEQIALLLREVKRSENPHVEIITLICLATGCRWSEAHSLTLDKIKNNSVVFVGTKSGRVRTVPVDTKLLARLRKHLERYRTMPYSLSAFNRALERTGIVLPKGQASHALRHTFASHFVMQGGNILVLQKILGHSTINMTMRYAHLAPSYLIDAVNLSPLNSFNFDSLTTDN